MIKSLKNAIWQIIRAEGIEVTNQNIDWLLERAGKGIPKIGAKVFIPFYDDDVGGANAFEETVEAVAVDKDGIWSVRDSDGFWHAWLSDAFPTFEEAEKAAEGLVER